MGVYIKDMAMPKDCWMCNFVDRDYGNCLVDGKEHDDYNKPKDCPLVPVPKHGRLIDADALKPYMLNEHYKYRLVYDAVEVANAPTIIPAEENNNDR